MLDQATKRKIDSARDILVGKVPDPKSQVEQITIALIYKFMDDMDKESEEWGGKASFFTGKYEKYAWSKIFDPRLGGFDLIALYGDALVEMNKNPNIPQLFRDIFKNAYLPYRDPETLKSFLKEINEFTYDHSERLGDAFEYLLSVMDSQGEAGQFRTPRHIIDFIVEIVDPKKNETVLDPACGTAGFLISSYKHILRVNTKERTGDKLTPDEKKRLMNNFTGYDISPDMVRLSLVNLYLHSFSNPKIHEYDTLTSEERWDETADVILANPPFMTPKGGIRPHKRFSIQAKRSEVLFVDYIAEHLNPSGRAGVVVPDGIIFQSSNAYKALRKMLVEDFLWGVVSLPAGVFQPYSGVKTSILLMDKTKAKQKDSILFVKVENDGFDLGAQRRSIVKNDLPEALKILQSGDADNTEMTHWVEKGKIEESGDWNLLGERYKDGINIVSQHYEMVELDEVCELESGSRQKGGALNEGIPSIGGAEISTDGKIKTGEMKYVSQEHFEKMNKGKLEVNDVLIVKDGATTGKTGFYFGNYKQAAVNEHVYILRSRENIKPIYLYSLVRGAIFQNKLKKYIKGIIGGIGLEIKSIQIPLPPMSVQEAMVAEIDRYQKIIDGARQVVNNYKPTIKIDPDWKIVALGEVAKVKGGFAFKSKEFGDEGIQVIKMGNVKMGRLDLEKSPAFMPLNRIAEFKDYLLKKNDILITMTGTENKRDYGEVSIIRDEKQFLLNQRVGKIEIHSGNILPEFLYLAVSWEGYQDEIFKRAKGVRQANISSKNLESIPIPLPPLSVQQKIVDQIETEQEIVNANKKLIAIYEKKIKDKIAEIWG